METADSPSPQSGSDHHGDRNLVEEIKRGSVDAWRVLARRYSGLIYRTIRQHIYDEDEEDVRAVFVELLTDLYQEKLATYEGRASLATWLAVIARAHAVDWLRSERGRHRLPAGYQNLNEFEQRVYQLYFVEKQSYDVLIQSLNGNGHAVTVDEIADAILRVEKTIGPRYLKKIEYDARAKEAGVASGRVLEYMLRKRAEFQGESDAMMPDAALIQEETNRLVARVAALREQLPPRERQMLHLRFDRGWTAKRIATEMGLSGQRRVYTMLDNVFRRLRMRMAAEEAEERNKLP